MNTKENKFHFWSYFKGHAVAVSIILLCYVISIAATVFDTILLAEFLAEITSAHFEIAFKLLFIGFIVKVIEEATYTVNGLVITRLRIKVTNAMSVDIAEQAFKITSKSYSDHNTSNFTRRISYDPSNLFNQIVMIIESMSDIISAVVITTYISTINVYIGLIMVGTLVIGAVLETFRRKIAEKNRKVVHAKNERAGSLLNEIVRSEKDIKCLNLEKPLKVDLKNKYDDYSKSYLKSEYTDHAMFRVRNFFVLISSFVILFLGTYFVQKGLIAFAAFMIVYSNRSSFRSLIWIIGRLTNYATEIRLSFSRINELYENKEYAQEKFGKRKLKSVKGNVKFDNVSFTYVDYVKNEDYEKLSKKEKKTAQKYIEGGKTKVFDKLSFEIEPNTTVAFVGKSGSGKSTILNLISKMYEVDKGKVLIDDVNINSLDKESIRSSISLVNQFPYIFDMSIKENLLMAKPDATDEDIDQAIKDAALEDFIKTLKNGLDSRVGESGIKLSGGQKQRLAIARALLKKSSIILFDESTSSLDNIAQGQIKQSIDNIKGKSTIVIVAHRLSTIKNVDKIFFLDNGNIVDEGTFDELYKRNKTFKTIFLAENI